MAEKESFFEGFRRNFSATLRPEALPCRSEKESFFEGFKGFASTFSTTEVFSLNWDTRFLLFTTIFFLRAALVLSNGFAFPFLGTSSANRGVGH
jgi:hypothetical protein